MQKESIVNKKDPKIGYSLDNIDKTMKTSPKSIRYVNIVKNQSNYCSISEYNQKYSYALSNSTSEDQSKALKNEYVTIGHLLYYDKEHDDVLKSEKKKNLYMMCSNLKLPQINVKIKNSKRISFIDVDKKQHKISQSIKNTQLTQVNNNNSVGKKIRNRCFYTVRSNPGCKIGIPKINQDICIVEQHLPCRLKLFCICDGHGKKGHLVASFIKKRLIQNLKSALKNIQDPQNIQDQIYFTFLKTNKQLLQSQINTEFSGSAVVAVFMYQDRILSFNVGNSRAILINYEYQRLKSQQISYDHTPDRKDQYKRVIANGGRIQYQMRQKNHNVSPILRVWMKDIQSPGLSMTRSFGDKAATQAGIIGQPQINQFILQTENKYLLIASKGVWQHLQNHEVVKYISKELRQQLIQAAADNLLQKAVQQWDSKSNSRDDISFILVKLNPIILN